MSQLDKHLNKVERYGFFRDAFPVYYKDHEIHLLKNDAHETIDGRLQIHLTLHCPRCGDENVVRGRLPPTLTNPHQVIIGAKALALSKFTEQCTIGPNHTYFGP